MPRIYECPFWKWERKNKDLYEVGCEQAFLRFRTKKVRDEYIARHCCSIDGYKKCIVAIETEKLYEKEDNNGR